MKKLNVDARNAKVIWEWMTNRGGVVIWKSLDLSDPSSSVTAPYRDKQGNINPQPNWKFGGMDRHITDTSDIEVETIVELKRMSVLLEQHGMKLLIKKSSERKCDRHLKVLQRKNPEKEVYWKPARDLFNHEAIFEMVSETKPLAQWIEKQNQ